MCIFHKWGNWEQYKEERIFIAKINSKEYKTVTNYQSRKCTKCNKKQVERFWD
jgi:hypothetical protein